MVCLAGKHFANHMLALKANVKKVSVVVFQKCRFFLVTVKARELGVGRERNGAQFFAQRHEKNLN